ncbi:hypothetical protein [Caballeronia humi]|nr:hypothetical protein [Caballeronia humi]
MRTLLSVALLATMLTACDSSSDKEAQSAPTTEAAPANATSAASTYNVARDEPDEATKRRCSKVGGLAYTIAAARNAGVHAGATFAETVEDPNNEVEPPAVLALAKQLYVGFAKQTSPDGARAAYYVDCLVTADAKSINGQSNRAAALAPFKTFTGEPLQKVLARQNIMIESILVQSVNTLRDGDQKGDEIYSLMLRGRPSKSAFCKMHDFSQVDENISEVIRPGVIFRQDKPTDLDLVMYWAATGKCNPEY